jgi:hypothetical protein
MAVECADLEIGLYGQDADAFTVELRYSSPRNDADVRRYGASALRFDREQLRLLAGDPAAYGRLLGETLFADADLYAAFAQARTHAAAQDVPLRVRLCIGPDVATLHDLRWETLRDPKDGTSLLTTEHLLFSRYLTSYDWRPVRLRPLSNLRALVVVADPSDLERYRAGGRPLARLDVDGELARARAGLHGVPITALHTPGAATLARILGELRDGCDFLYLVCHGALVDGQPWLWLENDRGEAERIAGRDLTTRLAEMRSPPRLIVLASCQSAGTGADAHATDDGALAALGPRLATAGVPAVLAMQGNITTSTVAEFMPVFFRELQRDGSIDRALSIARGAVRHRPDWWMPVLFMRLKSGRLWYATGFTGERRLEKWPAVISNIRAGTCTPVLGPGLVEPVLGSHRDIAQRWAETHHFPLAPHLREDLPQVAQYLATSQQLSFPQNELLNNLRSEMLRRYADDLAGEPREADLDRMISVVGAKWRARDRNEPHRVLASLPLPVYVTANYSSLLADALTEAGKEPRVEFCRWNDDLARMPSVYEGDTGYRPSPERPLVFHLFGHLKVPSSLLLTEDDYFDFLIGATRNQDLIPAAVRRALSDKGLLFLGFQLDDWNFRIVFRSLIAQEGQRRRRRYVHVAAQIDPEEGRILDPERARKYLEDYFQQSADINIYWGPPDSFMQDLLQQWEAGAR